MVIAVIKYYCVSNDDVKTLNVEKIDRMTKNYSADTKMVHNK